MHKNIKHLAQCLAGNGSALKVTHLPSFLTSSEYCGLSLSLASPTYPTSFLLFRYFKKIFYFDIILDLQEGCRDSTQGPLYPSPSFLLFFFKCIFLLLSYSAHPQPSWKGINYSGIRLHHSLQSHLCHPFNTQLMKGKAEHYFSYWLHNTFK